MLPTVNSKSTKLCGSTMLVARPQRTSTSSVRVTVICIKTVGQHTVAPLCIPPRQHKIWENTKSSPFAKFGKSNLWLNQAKYQKCLPKFVESTLKTLENDTIILFSRLGDFPKFCWQLPHCPTVFIEITV